jgi:hypothetical protein
MDGDGIGRIVLRWMEDTSFAFPDTVGDDIESTGLQSLPASGVNVSTNAALPFEIGNTNLLVCCSNRIAIAEHRLATVLAASITVFLNVCKRRNNR